MYLAELCVGCRRRGSLVTFRRNGSGESPWLAGGTVSLFMPVAPPTAPTPMGAAPGFRCWRQEEGEREKGTSVFISMLSARKQASFVCQR